MTDKEDGNEESEWYTEVGVWSRELCRNTSLGLLIRRYDLCIGGLGVFVGWGEKLDYSRRSSHSNRNHTEVKHRHEGGNVPELFLLVKILLVFACGWRDLTNTIVQN